MQSDVYIVPVTDSIELAQNRSLSNADRVCPSCACPHHSSAKHAARFHIIHRPPSKEHCALCLCLYVLSMKLQNSHTHRGSRPGLGAGPKQATKCFHEMVEIPTTGKLK